jgi:hypothetical protein
MKNKKFVAELAARFYGNEQTDVEIYVDSGLIETNYHHGFFQDDYEFTCKATTDWKTGKLVTSNHDVSYLQNLLSKKNLSELSSEDFESLELDHTHDGIVKVTDIKWLNPPPKQVLDELNDLDLHYESEITGSEYFIKKGSVSAINIKIENNKCYIDSGCFKFSSKKKS